MSIEPLLEDLGKVNFQGIHWAIVGGESGAKARPMKKEWVLNIKEQCNKQKIAFFFKQWGTWGEDNKKRSKKAFCIISFNTSIDEGRFGINKLPSEYQILKKDFLVLLYRNEPILKKLFLKIVKINICARSKPCFSIFQI